MILKASERANAAELARHLLNARDNDHVRLHDLRGFASADLAGAMEEAEAVSRGTRCRKFLFSLSLNPPETETVPVEVFETTIELAERRLGLQGQPRAVVFHEKEGRRHAHAVWSRIDPETMTAKNLPFYKTRLMEVSREVYLEHGWAMPRGMIDRSLRNPLNFSRAEWQQAKRVQTDPRLIKAAFRDCWNRSDSAESLRAALEERGYFLARGDRRGVVAVDWRGEVYALGRYAGAKAKEIAARTHDGKALPSVAERQGWIAERMGEKLTAWAREESALLEKRALALKFQREQMVQRQRAHRRDLGVDQAARNDREQRERAARVPTGLRGVWSWVTGKTRKIRLENELDMQRAQQRDRAEREAIVQKQLAERRTLQQRLKSARAVQHEAAQELNREAALYARLGRSGPEATSRQAPDRDRSHGQDRSRGRDREHDEPEFGL